MAEELNESVIYRSQWQELINASYSTVRKNAFQGTLKNTKFRTISWSILLRVLSNDHREWRNQRGQQREKYEELKREFMKNPHENSSAVDDDPLSQDDKSVWNQYFGDQELFGLIKQDVVRTFPGIEFFRKEEVQNSMTKILFFYAREHPYMCYRQGMHEILGPLFFTRFSNQKYLEHIKNVTDDIDNLLIYLLDPEFIEHDTYALFSRIMSAIGSYYRINNLLPTPDGYFPQQEPQDDTKNSEAEVISQLNYIRDNILKKEDSELYNCLMKMEIPIQIFGIRWLRLLFGREFPLMDLLVLWDAIFADGDKFDLPNYILVAMLIRIRDFLLHNDYTTCLTYLMKYPTNVDVNFILKHALYMYFPKPQSVNNPASPGQVKYQKKQVLKPITALSRSRNNSLPSETPKMGNHKKTFLSDLQIQQAKKIARFNHLQSTTGNHGTVINGISENSNELMGLELRHAQDVIMITQHKLSQYLNTFRRHINRNHSEELNQAVEGIEELCALLDVKFSSTNETAPVDAALEANEDKKRERSSSLVEPHPKFDDSKRSSSSESERTKYEVPDIKDSSKMFGRKKSVEMKTFLSDWQHIEVGDEQISDTLRVSSEK